MLSNTPPIDIKDAVGADGIAQARVNAVEYYRSGRVDPYEESFPLGDDKDIRFASVSFWPIENSNDLSPSIRIYLKRQAVHPEAHTMTTMVLVQDDHQTTLLGVNNLCRPGTLGSCLEPIAGKIDPGESEWATWEHEVAEERGVVPGHSFKSLQFLSKGLPGEKVPSMLVSRTFVIEAVLQSSDPTFNPALMQPNKPSHVRVASFVECGKSDIEDRDRGGAANTHVHGPPRGLLSAGMHLTPTPAYFLVKIKQLHRALDQESADFVNGLIRSLDIITCPSHDVSLASSVQLESLSLPDTVTARVEGPKYVTNDGVEAIDVEIHYGTLDGGGKTKTHSVLRVPEKKNIVVIPIFPDEIGGYNTLIVKKWQPGCGSGDQSQAWCLGFPSGTCKSGESIERSICRIVNGYIATANVNEGDIRILSRSGVFDVNAGMTNAKLEVIEVAFNRSLSCGTQAKYPDFSASAVVLDPQFRKNITRDLVKDGTRVDHVISAFATKMYQLDNALKTPAQVIGHRHWSHALPGIMKDPELDLGEEAHAIEAKFAQ